MGQKVSPTSLRLGINKDWSSRWSGSAQSPNYLKEDLAIRNLLSKRLKGMAVDSVQIDRGNNAVRVIIHTARPGDEEGNAVIVTADHGNAEELIDPLTKKGDTQHSTRNVPIVFIAHELKDKGDPEKSLEELAQEAPIGSLVDVAASVLYLFDVEKPREMTGSSLVSVE